MADEELTFTVRFNKETGQLVSATQDVEHLNEAVHKTGEKSKETGEKGADAFGKIEHHVTRMAMSLALGQLALDGFKKLTEESEGFQQIQSAVEELSSSMLDNLAPTIDLVARGLSGLISWVQAVTDVVKPVLALIVADVKAGVDGITSVIGAAVNLADGNLRGAWESIKQGGKDAFGEFDGIGTKFANAWDKSVNHFKEGLDRMSGHHKVFTKEMANELNAQLEEQQKHNDVVLKLEEDRLKQEASHIGTTAQQKIALIAQAEAAELANLKKNEDLKEQILKNKRESLQLTEKQFHAQMLVAQQQFEDARTVAERKGADERAAVALQEAEKLKQSFDEVENAFVSAITSEIKAHKNLEEALKAGGSAIVEDMANQAAKVIEIKGAEAAASDYSAASLVGGPIAGAIAAAKTLTWYSALAATVGGAGALIGSAITGDSGGGNSPSSSSSGGSSSPSAAQSSSASAAQMASGPAASGSPSMVTLLLDGQVLAKWVTQQIATGQIRLQ